MINLTLYTINKRSNSTALPGTGVAAVGTFKDETSLITPEILLAPITGIDITAFNYAYIPTLRRYYWITECYWMNGRYNISLKTDVLATYKAAIGSSSQYVLRSASAYNGDISDSLYPRKTNIQLAQCALGTNQRQNLESGFFLIGVISPDGSILGSISYYLLNWQAALVLRQKLLTDLTWTSVTEITDELLQTLFNPFQYFASYKWFPLSPPANTLTSVTSIKFGYWDFSITGVQGAQAWRYVAQGLPAVTVQRYSVPASNIPNHPQISRGRYMNGAGYAEYYLMMTGYGKVQLPNDVMIAGKGLTIYETIDFISGDSILNVYHGAGNDETLSPVITVKSHMGIDLPYGSSEQDILSAAGSVVSGVSNAIGSAVMGNIGGAITNVVSGIVDAAHDVAPTVQTGGRSGSFAALGEYTGLDVIQCVFHYAVDDDINDLGRPLCAVRTLSTLSGYIQCANPHVRINGTKSEQDEIEGYLASGIFYE